MALWAMSGDSPRTWPERPCPERTGRAGLSGGGYAGDGLIGEAVQRLDGELQVFLLRVLELRVREPAQALDEQHHRRHSGPRDLCGVVQRPAREPVRPVRHLADRLARELDQPLVEQDRLDAPDPL